MVRVTVNGGQNGSDFATEQEAIIWAQTTFSLNVQYVITDVTSEYESRDALKYLADTDWYVIREMDNGTPVPENIRQARQDARAKVIS